MLAKKNRLTAGFFRTRRQQLKSFEYSSVSVRVYRAGSSVFRCAVVVPVRVAKTAVLRNHIRRVVYALVQDNLKTLPVSDVVFFVSHTDTVYDDVVVVIKKIISELNT